MQDVHQLVRELKYEVIDQVCSDFESLMLDPVDAVDQRDQIAIHIRNSFIKAVVQGTQVGKRQSDELINQLFSN